MVDAAIPLDGNDWAKYVLVCQRCAISAWCPIALRHTGVLIALTTLVACGSVSDDRQQSPKADGSNESLVAPMSSLRVLLSASDESMSTPPGPVRFAQDLNLHPDSRVESFSVQAVLKDGARYASVQAAFDRVAISIEQDQTSKWSFAGVIRASIVTANSGDATASVAESIQRQALSLAGSTQQSIHVLNQRLQINQTNEAAPDKPASASGNSIVGQGDCDKEYQLDMVPKAGQALTLSWRVMQCPAAVSLATVNRWQTEAVPVVMQQSGERGQKNGWAWVSNTWGNLPATTGAVVLDQLNLLLDHETPKPLQLIASRSKRRTGRGPKTVLASLGTADNRSGTIQLVWSEEGVWTSPLTGLAYPQRYRVRSQAHGIDVQLQPLVIDSEIVDSVGTRWSGVVVASGTHEGIGFINFQPVDQANASNSVTESSVQ